MTQEKRMTPEGREALKLKLSVIELRDYPDLEGKVLTIVEDSGSGANRPAVVAGCCYDVGITFIDKRDKESKRICLNGRTRNDIVTHKIGYDMTFRYLVNSILEGSFDMDHLYDFIEYKVSPYANQTSCAFN